MRTLLVVLCAFLAAAAQIAAPPTPYFTLHEVAPGVFTAIANPGTRTGSNAGFIVGTRAVAVVDTFEDSGAARALLDAIHAHTSLPVRYVVNTHYHLDHVTGNQVFADAGATIMAQQNVPAWIHTENLKFFGAHPTAAQQALVAGYYAPDLTYRDGVRLDLGGREVTVQVFPGHTGGDSAVRVDGAGVVFTGDLFWNHSLPNLIDASTVPLIETLTELETWPQAAGATFIPGHGPVGKDEDVVAFRGYLQALRTAVSRARSHGLTGNVLVAAVVSELQPTYGGWSAFAHFGRLNAQQTAEELAGTKPRPTPVALRP